MTLRAPGPSQPPRCDHSPCCVEARSALDPPENLDRILAVLRRGHRYVEDTWYSCPQEPSEGCANDADGTECNCGYYERHAAADLLERIYRGVP